MIDEAIRVNLVSPPDRDLLACEIMVGNEQMAELNQEGNALTLEIYPRRDGKPWTISYDELSEALAKAKDRLRERSNRS